MTCIPKGARSEVMMREKKIDTRMMALSGILGAIVVVLASTPLGFVPIGPIMATTIHIPVVIGAIVGGPLVGALVGLFFGLTSFSRAILTPTITSFVNLNPLLSIVPRVLFGLLTGLLYQAIRERSKNKTLATVVATAFGCLFHTTAYLTTMYFLFGSAYMTAIGQDPALAAKFLATVGLTNGIPEMILAVILALPITKVIQWRR